MKRAEAIRQGFTIDDSCYPPIAYKGHRFNTVVNFAVLTELEESLLEVCEQAEEKIKDTLTALVGFGIGGRRTKAEIERKLHKVISEAKKRRNK